MKKIIYLFPIFFTLFSCNNKDSAEVLPTTPTGILTYGSWEIADFFERQTRTVSGALISLEEANYADMAICEKDNTFNFKENGEFFIATNQLKCLDTETDTLRKGSWSYSESDSMLTILGEDILVRNDGHSHSHGANLLIGDEYHFKIKHLALDSFVLHFEKQLVVTTSITITDSALVINTLQQ